MQTVLITLHYYFISSKHNEYNLNEYNLNKPKFYLRYVNYIVIIKSITRCVIKRWGNSVITNVIKTVKDADN